MATVGNTSLHPADIAIIVIYFIFILTVGLWVSCEKKTIRNKIRIQFLCKNFSYTRHLDLTEVVLEVIFLPVEICIGCQ